MPSFNGTLPHAATNRSGSKDGSGVLPKPGGKAAISFRVVAVLRPRCTNHLLQRLPVEQAMLGGRRRPHIARPAKNLLRQQPGLRSGRRGRAASPKGAPANASAPFGEAARRPAWAYFIMSTSALIMAL